MILNWEKISTCQKTERETTGVSGRLQNSITACQGRFSRLRDDQHLQGVCTCRTNSAVNFRSLGCPACSAFQRRQPPRSPLLAQACPACLAPLGAQLGQQLVQQHHLACSAHSGERTVGDRDTGIDEWLAAQGRGQ